IFGAALLYGDGTITPAISVLSAIEGLEVATPVAKPYIVPITLFILFLLFLLQHRGTGKVGMLFGPVMSVWFLVIALSGFINIVQNPLVLTAFNPLYAIEFIFRHGQHSLFIIGAVFLVVTGGEALYADIGHFGRFPIRLAWFSLVLPALLINYLGQGALLIRDSSLAFNPFYNLTPDWALYPMVFLATFATIIASQAIISGIFSLTFQALQLGYLPRLRVRHTSEEEHGQIYIPKVNWLLFAATSCVVLAFQQSGNLAAAYGVAVSTTMVITTLLGYVAMTALWKWKKWTAIPLTLFFLTIDFSFFSANMLKILEGGWYPLLVGGIIYLIMSTWAKGQVTVARQLRHYSKPLKSFIRNIDMRTVKKVHGTAIYLTQSPLVTPPTFIQNIQHNRIIHQRVFFFSVCYSNTPYIRSENRIRLDKLPRGYYRVVIRYGFMNRTDIRAVIRIIQNKYLKIDMEETTIFVGRETLIPSQSIGMSKWRDRLYLLLANNSERAVKYFNIPPEQAMEIGVHIKF
ncbi:MAG: KUP/HAK/KT family potassium transporter, partial [Calditrichaceae bacterium]